MTSTATPIVDAAELHRAGYHRDAARLLEGLLAIDIRCIDAWAHLGLIAFDTRGPGPARELYETGVAIAERSLPDGFDAVLPWGWVDNPAVPAVPARLGVARTAATTLRREPLFVHPPKSTAEASNVVNRPRAPGPLANPPPQSRRPPAVAAFSGMGWSDE